MFAAWILVRRPHWVRQPGLWLAAGLAAVLVMVVGAGPRDDFLVHLDAPWLLFHHSLLAAAFAMLMLGVAAGSPLGRRLFAGRVLVWIGLISYSLYLWHYPLLTVWQYLAGAGWFGGWSLVALFGVATPSILLVSWLSYRYVELPFLAMRK